MRSSPGCVYVNVVVQWGGKGGGGGGESCLWSVQEESHSPVQPGCSGLGPPDEKIYGCHVDMHVCQDLETWTMASRSLRPQQRNTHCSEEW